MIVTFHIIILTPSHTQVGQVGGLRVAQGFNHEGVIHNELACVFIYRWIIFHLTQFIFLNATIVSNLQILTWTKCVCYCITIYENINRLIYYIKYIFNTHFSEIIGPSN